MNCTPIFLVPVSRLDEQKEIANRHPNADFRWVSYRTLTHALSIREENWVETLEQLRLEHAQRPFAGVLNRREKFVAPAARLADGLGLKPHLADPQLARDKLAMRRTLYPDQVSFPVWEISEECDFLAIPDKAFPLILKPRFGFNSRCIAKVNHAREGASTFSRLQARYRRLKQEENQDSGFLAEAFIVGDEHTVEAVVMDGKIVHGIISDKLPVDPHFFTEVGDCMPSRLPQDTQDALLAEAQRAVTALGFQNGWAHIEIRQAASGPVTIEIAARMGGGYHEELIHEVYGIDRLKTLMGIMLGELDSLPDHPKRRAVGVRSLYNGVGYMLRHPNVLALDGQNDVAMIWPEQLRGRKRVIIGPPLGYKNTLFEFIVTGHDAESLITRAQTLLQDYCGTVIGLPKSLQPLVEALMPKANFDG